MKDLSNPTWIKLKGLLFVLLGVAAAVLIWLEQPTLKVAALLVLVIWCFCRAYYFAFYVIEHYVDSSFKFSGLGAFLAYMFRQRQRKP